MSSLDTLTKWIIVSLFFIFFFTIGGLNWWVYSNINDDTGDTNNIKKAKTITASYASILLVFIVGMMIAIYFKPVRKFIAGSLTAIFFYILMFVFLIAADVIGWYIFNDLNKKVQSENSLETAKRLSLTSASIITAVFCAILLYFVVKGVVLSQKNKKEKKARDGKNDDSISNYMKKQGNYYMNKYV